MGLFKESRKPDRKPTGGDDPSRSFLDDVSEEDKVDPGRHTPLVSSPTKGESRSGRASRRSSGDVQRAQDAATTTTTETAEAHIVSSPRRSYARDEQHLAGSWDEDDSGWSSTSSSDGSDGDQFGGSETETEEEAMTVPLQPYGHAVGGHSSIYQFTRAAICKPLMSRENIFYEDVERLAPALLPYIPRYLGVMLELFIFMEDLTGRLKKPCVLDLKMGTRQYGYDATPLKQISQRKKCDATTSRTLGVRMCGMQVWNNATQEFTSKNKYRGRELKTADFPRVLGKFLSDGDEVLADHIPFLMQKMYNLAAILSTLNSFRFYGCSLLLIYDGDKEIQEHFAKHVHRAPHERSGSLFSVPRRRISMTGSRRSRSADVGGDDKQVPAPHHQHRKVRGEIVVRIVDFAHTTTGQDIMFPYPPGVKDPPNMGKGYLPLYDEATGLALARFPPVHFSEPDLGFIFGIRSVVGALKEIYAVAMEQRRARGLPVATLPEFDHADIFDKLFPPGFDMGYLST
ncbi:hypothetical protein VHUM_03013 [Vanrija humicola]|uniref:Kinase n=1 Tax=Vanrija humicola TaxID=5417 RepID=A0A7D8Z881_VANHU|nr:hypothetical protein VHUM_03013 [Vanrija humicola]